MGLLGRVRQFFAGSNRADKLSAWPSSADVEKPYTVPFSTAVPIKWNEHWARVVSNENDRRHARCRLPLSPCLRFLDQYRVRNWQSVLVLGCGISAEPAAIARAGYEVLATDASSFAIDYMLSHPASDDEIAYWHLNRREPQVAERVSRCRYEVRDLAEAEPSVAFDVVYLPWIWQCLSLATQRSCLQHLQRWVRPGGACLVTAQNTRHALDAFKRDFTQAGFFDPYDTSRRWNSEGRSFDKYQRLYAKDESAALRRLAAGERLAELFLVVG